MRKRDSMWNDIQTGTLSSGLKLVTLRLCCGSPTCYMLFFNKNDINRNMVVRSYFRAFLKCVYFTYMILFEELEDSYTDLGVSLVMSILLCRCYNNAQVYLWGCCFVKPEQGSKEIGNHSHMLLLLIALRALFSSLLSVAFLQNTSDNMFCHFLRIAWLTVQ